MGNKKTEHIYEVSYHLLPSLSDDERERIVADIRGGVAQEGEILSVEELLRVDLAYTIRHTVRQGDGSYMKYDDAYFGSVKLRAPQEYMQKLHQHLQSNESVLRFLIVETVAEDTRIGEPLPGEAQPENAAPAEKESERRVVRNTAQYQV